MYLRSAASGSLLARIGGRAGVRPGFFTQVKASIAASVPTRHLCKDGDFLHAAIEEENGTVIAMVIAPTVMIIVMFGVVCLTRRSHASNWVARCTGGGPEPRCQRDGLQYGCCTLPPHPFSVGYRHVVWCASLSFIYPCRVGCRGV